MKLDDRAVTACCAEHYSGSLATRALWQWAGGNPEEVDFSTFPEKRWAHLWALAKGEGKATAIGLIREMLFDRPGTENLLGFLDTLTEDVIPQRPALSRVFLAALDRAAPDFDRNNLWVVLRSFPSLHALVDRPEEFGLGIVATAMNLRYGKAVRVRLEEALEAIREDASPPSVEAVRDQAVFLLRHSHDLAEIELPEPLQNKILEAATLLEGHDGRTMVIPHPELGETTLEPTVGLAVIEETLRPVETGAEILGNPFFSEVLAAVFRLHACLLAMARHEPAGPVLPQIDALLAALWCTCPRETADGASPDDTREPLE